MRLFNVVICGVLMLSGCSGRPIFSAGLSSAAANVSQDRPPGVRSEMVATYMRSASKLDSRLHSAKVVELDPAEEPYDRALREMNLADERIERAARLATNSICRGC
jgi:hypothetical protein